MFLPHPRVKVSIVGSLRDPEVACSASDRQGTNSESCVWSTVSSQSSHHPQEVLLAQFSLYVHKGGLKPDSFHLFKISFVPKSDVKQWFTTTTTTTTYLWNWHQNIYKSTNFNALHLHMSFFEGQIKGLKTDVIRTLRSDSKTIINLVINAECIFFSKGASFSCNCFD